MRLLGAITDHKLNFDVHLILLCKEAGKKLSALARLGNFLSLEQRKRLMKSFIESQFGYCPLTRMFCGRKTNTRINHAHERADDDIADEHLFFADFGQKITKTAHFDLIKHENDFEVSTYYLTCPKFKK